MSDESTPIPAWSTLLADPLDARLADLTARLAVLDGPADEAGVWPSALWSTLLDFEVPQWSLPAAIGGDEQPRAVLLQRYARIAEGSMTAAFILSQHDAGVRRLVGAGDRDCARHWLGKIAAGEAFTSVGISQLTTSRRHGPRALTANETADGFVLNGVMPW